MNEKELIKRLVACLIIILACYFAFAYISTRNVHDNGNGVGKVRTELTNAQATQREETRVIDETEKAITRGKQAVDESTRTNKSIKKLERKDAELIDECQQILARVRERNASKD